MVTKNPHKNRKNSQTWRNTTEVISTEMRDFVMGEETYDRVVRLAVFTAKIFGSIKL